MQYRKDAKGTPLSALGMGCMRFPRSKDETEKLVLAAIDGGVNFFDTAYMYPGSEATLGAILAKHGKRQDVYIATKLPIVACKGPEDFEKYFAEQLKRLQTDYIDYYFMHNMSDLAAWERLAAWGIEEWLAQKQQSGAIRQVGFSFHGTYDEFIKILDSYPWSFTMLQYNYYDPNYQAGRKGLQTAAERGIAVMIMEPLLGGRLATGLPQAAVDIFKAADDTAPPADWALRWLWHHPEVTVVVSGMSGPAVLEANLRAMQQHTPLSAADLAVYDDVVTLFRKSYKINCTACNYCLPCPKGINIPAVLSAYNTRYIQGYITGMTLYMTSTAALTKTPTTPRTCNHCGKCEKSCPQNLPIRNDLKRVARALEPWPIRAVLALVRRVLG